MTDTFLFDMDGVLIDSEPVSIRILMDWFLLKGVRLTRKDVEPYLGAGEEVFFTGPAGERGMDVDLAEASLYFKEHYPSLMAASLDDCALCPRQTPEGVGLQGRGVLLRPALEGAGQHQGDRP